MLLEDEEFPSCRYSARRKGDSLSIDLSFAPDRLVGAERWYACLLYTSEFLRQVPKGKSRECTGIESKTDRPEPCLLYTSSVAVALLPRVR